MIVDGKIIFQSSESDSYERTLVYQEYLSNRKATFVLPEIVELMEKAQDKVIRADYKNPFLISGPAGSGKTTLALHRVAYLAQSPETSELFTGDTVIVFVQDQSTKSYFSHLLPELGIKNVMITTLYEWEISILNLKEWTFAQNIKADETENDLIQYHKNVLLKRLQSNKLKLKKELRKLDFLSELYSKYSDFNLKEVFDLQKQAKALDRFDLALMTYRQHQLDGQLTTEYVELGKKSKVYIKELSKETQ